MIALGFGFGPIFKKAGAGNYMEFLAPGIISQGILFTGMFSGIEIIWDRQFGFLKETLVAPVSRLNIMIGRTLGGATIATMQGVIIFFLSLIVGFRPASVFSVFSSLLVMFLMSVLFTALGTAIASTLDDFQGFQLIMNFLVMPMFFLSGALFPLSGLPKAIEVVSKINPLTYGVDGLRATLTGISHFGISVDLFVLSIITVIILSIGSYLFSKIQV
jgi:ABC-2 type transport system permease protein